MDFYFRKKNEEGKVGENCPETCFLTRKFYQGSSKINERETNPDKHSWYFRTAKTAVILHAVKESPYEACDLLLVKLVDNRISSVLWDKYYFEVQLQYLIKILEKYKIVMS